MPAATSIAWNGVRLSIPAQWEPRVTGTCQLVFEEEFQPLLQLRWYKQSSHSSKESQGLAAALAKQSDTLGARNDWSAPWRKLESTFQVLAFSPGRDGTPRGGAFTCPHCHTFFHFQVFPDRMAGGEAMADTLLTLSCHDHEDDLWRIQDFSLGLPPGFSLTDYSFAAGLTRLSFQAGKVRLEAARLAPADDRLRRQSLSEILLAQAGLPGLQLADTGDRNSCEGFRSPGMLHRLRLRLRGDRPFVRARIVHDPLHNRLLSLILSGASPLPVGLLPEIADNYGII